MSVDVLQEKIRKSKNPTMVELLLPLSSLPPRFPADAKGCGSFCRELLAGLKGTVPAARFTFAAFALLGGDGMGALAQTRSVAEAMGYYALLDAPELLSPTAAQLAADRFFGEGGGYPCDGLVISGYLGSDIVKPFLPYCKDGKKDLFVVARTGNKSAPELQDLLTGSRLVHTVAVDLTNRFSGEAVGKFGYSRVGAVAAATAAESLRSLRSKYPAVFFLLDGFDSPSANAKNCSFAFDKYGRGAVVCAGESITCAWKQGQSDGSDFVDCAVKAAERMKKNLTRYVTVL